MNPLFEESPLAAPAPIEQTDQVDYDCFSKAKGAGEHTFTLRAQDLTAPVLVTAWANAQRYLAWRMDRGDTLETAMEALERRLFCAFEDVPNTTISEKVAQAFRKAKSMEAWPARRLAD